MSRFFIQTPGGRPCKKILQNWIYFPFFHWNWRDFEKPWKLFWILILYYIDVQHLLLHETPNNNLNCVKQMRFLIFKIRLSTILVIWKRLIWNVFNSTLKTENVWSSIPSHQLLIMLTFQYFYTNDKQIIQLVIVIICLIWLKIPCHKMITLSDFHFLCKLTIQLFINFVKLFNCMNKLTWTKN